jgi:hypothetical protein
MKFQSSTLPGEFRSNISDKNDAPWFPIPAHILKNNCTKNKIFAFFNMFVFSQLTLLAVICFCNRVGETQLD